MERELVLAARLGDEVAFARLIEAEAPSFRWSAGAPSYDGLCSPSPEATTAI